MSSMVVRVQLDVYPAKVTLPSGAVLNRARAIIADNRLLVYVANNGVPHLQFERDISSIEGSSPINGVRVLVEDGVVELRKAGGCGCGSRLKSYNPFRGQTVARVTL